MDTPNYRLDGFTVFEGSCPRGETHVYTVGSIICHKCGGNRLREPYHKKNTIRFWGKK